MLDIPNRQQSFNAVEIQEPPVVLHLVPAEAGPAAVEDLAGSDSSLVHIVLSVTRTAATFRAMPPKQTGLKSPHAADEMALQRWGGRFRNARRDAIAIQHRLTARGVVPDLVQCHGAAISANVGRHLARLLNVPMAASLGADLSASFPAFGAVAAARALRDAALVLLRPTWNERSDTRRLVVPGRAVLLPHVACNATRTIRPRAPSRGFLAAAPLDSWRRNGLLELFWALAITARKLPHVRLDIVGSGSPRAFNRIRIMLVQLGISSHVSLLGPVPYERLLAMLPDYLALAFPGTENAPKMLPVEALFAGAPLLITRATDRRGFLADFPFGLEVDATRVEDIAEALSSLYENNGSYRSGIADRGPDLYRRFGPEGVSSAYSDAVRSILPGRRERR